MLEFSAITSDASLVTTQTNFVNVNCHEVNFDVKDNQNGQTSVTICARDIDGLADCDEIEFVVNAINDAPILILVGIKFVHLQHKCIRALMKNIKLS